MKSVTRETDLQERNTLSFITTLPSAHDSKPTGHLPCSDFFLSGCITKETSRTPEAWVDQTIAGLSLEKKVAQLVCTEISGNYIAEDDPKLQSWIALARDHGIGGFVVYGGTPHSMAILLNRLQREADIPILISTDFEGGPGQQVGGASEFPANMAFAATGDEDLMYRAAKIMAEEGRAMGIHLSYTPVADISLSPNNPQESGRSFGGNIPLLGKMIAAYVRGYHEMGMLTTAKHFPGRGDMKGGPVYPSFTKIDKDSMAIDSLEFRAFRLAVDAGVDFMMTEHIAVPGVTGNDMTASVEPKLARDVVRGKLGFKGILTSDDLWYDHVIERFGKEDVAVKAMLAGHDIVLKPKDPVATITAIAAAVREGRLPEAHVDQALRKLLLYKARLGLHENRFVRVDSVTSHVGTVQHRQVIQEVADRSLTMLINNGGLPVKQFNPAKSVHILIQKDEEYPNGRVLLKEMAAAFPGLKQFTLRPQQSDVWRNEVRQAAVSADKVIISFMVQRDRHGDPAPLRKDDISLLQEIILKKPGNVVAMSFGNPHLSRHLKGIGVLVVGYGEGGFYGNQIAYINTWIRFLKGEVEAIGRLPVRL